MSESKDQMMEDAIEFNTRIKSTIHEIKHYYSPKLSDLTPENLRVATMTVSFKTNLEFCDVSSIEEFEDHLPECMTVTQPKGKKGNMLNCVILKLALAAVHVPVPAATATAATAAAAPVPTAAGKKGKKKIASEKTENASIMLFSNGALNVTGCKSLTDAVGAAKIACCVLDRKHGDPIGSVKLLTSKVQMINTNFETATGFKLSKVHATLINMRMNATYDNNVHPGVVWEFATSFTSKRLVTIAIFSSGNVIITGIVDPIQLKEAYVAVTQMLNNHFADLCVIKGLDDDIDAFDSGDGVKKGTKKRGRKSNAEKAASAAALARLAA